MKINKRIGIILVSYKNFLMTQRFVKKEVPKFDVDYVLIIVNVASNENESKKLAQESNIFFSGEELCEINNNQRQQLIWSSKNLGYAKGNNLGVEYLKRAGFNCDYYLFTNDDVEILSSNLLQSLISKSETDDYIAGIGPRVICRDGAEGSPQREYFSPWRIMGESFFSSLKCKRKRTIDCKPNKIAPYEGPAYWISGAFMLIKSNWFNKVNGFDSMTFLYYEEPILAEKFKFYGGYFYYYPKVMVLHYEGGSTQEFIRNKQKIRIVEKSRIYYYKKYMNVTNITIFIYKLFCLIKRMI